MYYQKAINRLTDHCILSRSTQNKAVSHHKDRPITVSSVDHQNHFFKETSEQHPHKLRIAVKIEQGLFPQTTTIAINSQTSDQETNQAITGRTTPIGILQSTQQECYHQ
jgi:hypothetical protein